ncbi:AAA family ATPase [Mucilaginibacter sp. HMF5004]|uniref:GumC family protein n=1 Tax=Mucilaginibacter rivuli TaxID=2857527 RepID=UPI001C5F8A4C|nr:polysaccharide biosynthesis tyrosine autokinase [Mucilaginibacter rivuli]MBW4890155.1 AAA family ATPase [Mucilaginibacter rivuli]
MEYNKNQHIESRVVNTSGSSFSIKDLFIKLLKLWYWIILSVTFCTGLAYLYFLKQTPQYKIHATVLVQDEKRASDRIGRASALQDLGGVGVQNNADNELLVLKSRTPMAKTVAQLQLFISYFEKAKLKKTEIYSTRPINVQFTGYPLITAANNGSYEVKVDTAAKTFSLFKPGKTYKGSLGDSLLLPEGLVRITRGPGFASWDSQNSLFISMSDFEATVEKYMGVLTTELPNKQTSIINLTIVESLPDKGETILNEFITQYLKENLEDKNRIADGTIAFIDERLALVSKELSGSESNIENFKRSNNLADLKQQSNLLIESDSRNSERATQLEVQLSVMQNLQSFLKDNVNDRKTVPSSLAMSDPNFIALVKSYNDLQLERDKKLMTQTTDNPAIITIDQQLRNLRLNLLSSIESIVRGLRTSIDKLGRYSTNYESQISSVPEKERRLQDYARQQSIKQELYIYLLTKREESAVSKASNIATTRIIDYAHSEHGPFKPSKTIILFTGLLVGLVLPFGFSFGISQVKNRVNTVDDIYDDTIAPIIAHVGRKPKHSIFAISAESKTLTAEKLRGLVTHLRYAFPGDDNKTILVTSSGHGEGKSFIAINLAQTLALSHKKVLLLELDLRSPNLSTALGLQNIGFTNYIAEEANTWEPYIQQAGIDYFFDVFCAGEAPANPTMLLQLPVLKILMGQLQEVYDYIVVDSSPVGLVTDAEILAAYASFTLYIVRQNYSSKAKLKNLDNAYREGILPKINVIINDCKAIGSK